MKKNRIFFTSNPKSNSWASEMFNSWLKNKHELELEKILNDNGIEINENN